MTFAEKLSLLHSFEANQIQKERKMLPFRKRQDDGVGVGPAEVKVREPDDDGAYDMLDAVAEDILAAIAAKDKALLKGALSALVSHVQDADAISDEAGDGG